MKNILRINGWIEGMSGFILIFWPHLLLQLDNPDIHAIAVSKLYGMLALIFGIISYILSSSFTVNQAGKRIVLTVISFHFIVSLFMYGLYQQQITPNFGAFVVHLCLAILFLVLYLREDQNITA